MKTRKEFLTKTFKMVTGAVATVIDKKLPAEFKEFECPLFPPGAAEDFIDRCAACGDCAMACPAGAIKLKNVDLYGRKYPVIEPSKKACVMCESLWCIDACCSEALVMNDENVFPKMGTAVIKEDFCLAYNGSSCMTCYDACPLKRSAIKMKSNKPVIIDEECTGCGICEEVCVINRPKGIVINPHSFSFEEEHN